MTVTGNNYQLVCHPFIFIESSVTLHKALNFTLEGAKKLSSGKGHIYEENVNFYWNFPKQIFSGVVE